MVQILTDRAGRLIPKGLLRFFCFLCSLRQGLLRVMVCGLLFPHSSLAVDTSTDAIYAAHKDALVQIRMADRVAGSKSSIGSGFLLGDQGLIVTNYHVISELVFRPGDYRATFSHESGETGALALMAVDVVHDLAVLKAEKASFRPLLLAPKAPVQGEKLYSLGNPHDLGMTIVEGTYNGHLEESLYEKIHFTGSINPGMSGGPTLNHLGEVVGINVATAGNQLSFLVPVSYLKALLEGVPQEPPAEKDLLDVIRDQLLANQDKIMKSLGQSDLKTAALNGYRVPAELADFFKCWGDRRPAEEGKLFQTVFQSCSSNDDIYLTRDFATGNFRFRHEVFTAEKMGTARFYNFLERHFSRPHLQARAEEEDVSNFRCTTDFVTHGGGESKVVLCLRAYKKLDGLYDAFLTLASLNADHEALHSSLFLGGVSEENALNFSRDFLEAIQWKP